jgi:hypothetical protein
LFLAARLREPGGRKRPDGRQESTPDAVQLEALKRVEIPTQNLSDDIDSGPRLRFRVSVRTYRADHNAVSNRCLLVQSRSGPNEAAASHFPNLRFRQGIRDQRSPNANLQSCVRQRSLRAGRRFVSDPILARSRAPRRAAGAAVYACQWIAFVILAVGATNIRGPGAHLAIAGLPAAGAGGVCCG